MGTNAIPATSRAPLSHAKGGAPAYDVVVIGGGASGLAAAITAARAGARVCIIERDVEAGLGLLATGNGRCNISNARLDSRRYAHPDAAQTLIGDDGAQRISDFFEQLGLLCAQEDEGRLYPVTKRAESVRDVLLAACTRLGVDLWCCAELTSAQINEDTTSPAWALTVRVPAAPLSYKRGRDGKASVRNARKALAACATTERPICAARVIIAVGGRSEGTCKLFAVPHIDEEPVLCPIACSFSERAAWAGRGGSALEALDGLRVEGMLTLVRDGASIAFEQGEILFRPYGVSGIAAFNLSRRIQPGDTLELDVFPTMNDAALRALLQRRAELLGPYTGDPSWFDGILPRALATLVAHLLASAHDPLAQAATLLHRIPLSVAGTTEHTQAHVHRGGIPLPSIDLATCAVADGTRALGGRGLFACGEALDMDADCGGYNLAWAWLSGMRAGAHAAASAHRVDAATSAAPPASERASVAPQVDLHAHLHAPKGRPC